MASTFETDFQSGALPLLLSLHGRSGDYYDPDATTATVSGCTLLVSTQPATLTMVNENDEVAAYNATISVQASEVATPELDGLFAVGADWWRITAPPQQYAGLWRCSCMREELKSIGKQVRSRR